MASSTLKPLPTLLLSSPAPLVSPVATSVSVVLLVCGAIPPTIAVRLLFVILFLEVLTCPTNGDWSQTNAGETATLSCAEGQTGSRTRLCTLTGTWENEVNTCGTYQFVTVYS